MPRQSPSAYGTAPSDPQFSNTYQIPMSQSFLPPIFPQQYSTPNSSVLPGYQQQPGPYSDPYYSHRTMQQHMFFNSYNYQQMKQINAQKKSQERILDHLEKQSTLLQKIAENMNNQKGKNLDLLQMRLDEIERAEIMRAKFGSMQDKKMMRSRSNLHSFTEPSEEETHHLPHLGHRGRVGNTLNSSPIKSNIHMRSRYAGGEMGHHLLPPHAQSQIRGTSMPMMPGTMYPQAVGAEEKAHNNSGSEDKDTEEYASDQEEMKYSFEKAESERDYPSEDEEAEKPKKSSKKHKKHKKKSHKSSKSKR